MKLLPSCLFLAFVLPVVGQTFTKAPSSSDIFIEGRFNSKYKFFNDLNNDGAPDIIWLSLNNGIKIFINDGNGEFTDIPNPTLSNIKPENLKLADLDGDEFLDIIIYKRYTESKVFINDGEGVFTEKTDHNLPDFRDLLVLDLNRDGFQDIVPLRIGIGSSGVFINNGAGSYIDKTPEEFSYLNQIHAFIDINNDGLPDFVQSNRDLIINFGQNNGDGTFSITDDSIHYSQKPGFLRPRVVDVHGADFDNDGDQDLLIMFYQNHENYQEQGIPPTVEAKFYNNDGNGRFSEKTDFSLELEGDYYLDIVDLNQDRFPDISLLSATGQHDIFTNNGSGGFDKKTSLQAAFIAYDPPVFYDIDQDGDLDLLSNERLDQKKLYINDGAGNFIEHASKFPFSNFSAIADIDRDGDADLILSRFTSRPQGGLVIELYLQDNPLRFVDMMTPVIEGGDANSKLAFADVDLDTDQDLLVLIDGICKLYNNDGSGNFTENTENAFGQNNSLLVFADVDRDSDPDLLIGNNGNSIKAFFNDGNGTFTENSEKSIQNQTHTSFTLADVDGDNDPDLVIVSDESSILWTNDGSGRFEQTDKSFESGLPSFQDLFRNGYPDLIISRLENSFVYRNTSNGLIPDLPSQKAGFVTYCDLNNDGIVDRLHWNNDGVAVGNNVGPDSLLSIEINLPNDGDNVGGVIATAVECDPSIPITPIDLNKDGYLDLIYGEPGGQLVLYINGGAGINEYYGRFTRNPNSSLPAIGAFPYAFTDVDRDGDQDLFVIETDQSRLYLNDGSGNFSPWINSGQYQIIEPVMFSAAAFSDIEGGNQYLLIAGQDSTYEPVARAYSFDQNGELQEVPDFYALGALKGAVAFSYVDGDQKQDMIITGSNRATGASAELVLQMDTPPLFEPSGDPPFEGVERSSMAVADANMDGNDDFFVTGLNRARELVTELYLAQGDGTFEPSDYTFDFFAGSIAFANVTASDHPDICICGLNDYNQPVTKLYINDGAGSFAESSFEFEQLKRCDVNIADFTGDGKADILISGSNQGNDPAAFLYVNTGNDEFEERATSFNDLYVAGQAISDIDLDGNVDILISALGPEGERNTRIYLNDGSGAFTEALSTPLTGVSFCSLAINDINRDGLPDLLITGGAEGFSKPVTKIYLQLRN